MLSSSNNLILKSVLDNTNASNYVLSTSNNLILKSVLDNTNASNYVLSTSNNLILKSVLDNTNASNYVLSTSNNLILKSVLDNTNASNYVLITNNLISSRITDLTTDLINENTNAVKKFIVNNRYNNNLEVNGNLTINSNLIVLGDSTRLDTIVYTTERLEVVNANNTTTALMVQQNSADRDIFIASNINTTVFRIANNGDLLINGDGVYKKNNRDVILDTSNYVSSINTALTTSIGTKQATINSTANQLIIGNGNGVTTTDAGLTFSANTLFAPTFNGSFTGSGANITGLTESQIPSLATSKITGLDTALSGKQATLTSTLLAPLLNTTTDFVVNGSKIDLSQHTSNYIARVNTALTTSIGAKQDTLTSTLLAPLLNTTTDFVVNGSKIDLSQHTSNYIARVNTALTTSISGKANTTHTHVIGDVTGLQTAIDAKQAIINSTANQLIIGNGNGVTTTNAGLTFATDTLTATNIAGAGANITALNMGNALTGTLAVGRGGTGSTALTAGQVLIGNTTTISQTANLSWSIANNRLGIGTATPAVSLHVVGEIVATNNITSYYSDERLKTKISDINEPLKIINNLNGFYYIPNELARINGITNTSKEIGLSAQEVQKVLPEIVKIAPFDLETDKDGNKISKSGENYLTMSYERLAPVFVEAIKELHQKNIVLEQKNIELNDKYNILLEDITIIKKKLDLL